MYFMYKKIPILYGSFLMYYYLWVFFMYKVPYIIWVFFIYVPSLLYIWVRIAQPILHKMVPYIYSIICTIMDPSYVH